MNFKKLLESPVEEESKDIGILFGSYYNHVDPEIDQYTLDFDKVENQDRIKLKYYKYFSFDCRRYWALYSVWFDEELVMICKNAGREGDDHTGRAVFDESALKGMISYIKSFEKAPYSETEDLVSLDDDATSFESFYGNNLTGYFERH